jgi:hypothetical protein
MYETALCLANAFAYLSAVNLLQAPLARFRAALGERQSRVVFAVCVYCSFSCHGLPASLETDVSDGGMLLGAAHPWPTERLCVPGVLISNGSLGKNWVLTVSNPPQAGFPQNVELRERETELSYTQVWRLLSANQVTDSYWIDNPRPPFNKLSISLTAAGNLPDQDNASGEDLEWFVRREGDVNTEGAFDAISFVIAPASASNLALDVTPDETHALRLSTPDGTSPLPASILWSFAPLDLCDP